MSQFGRSRLSRRLWRNHSPRRSATGVGCQPFGIDDWVNVTVRTPSGKEHKVKISENDAWGKPIGEQWVLSNVVAFEKGCHEVTCELWNQFVPAGPNAGSSAIWLVSS